MSLRERMHELADGARSYADPDAAVARARRLRVTSTAVPLGVAGLVLSGLVLSGLPWLPADGPAEVDHRYPAAVAFETAPPLPANRAVGTASFVYGRCTPTRSACEPFLVLPDGKQYALPEAPGFGTILVTLSPNGRWLGWSNGIEFYLRDLHGQRERLFRGKSGWTGARWSPDGRWLVLSWNNMGEFTIIDMNTGKGTFLDRVPGWPTVVTNEGNWIVWDTPFEGGYDVLDPRTGRTEHHRVTPSVGRAGEYALPPVLTPCSCTAMVPLFPSGTVDPYFVHGPVVAIVEVDLADGHVITRLDLPRDDGSWHPKVALPDEGILLLHVVPDATEIVQLNTISGQRLVVSRLPAGVDVILRGAGTPTS